MLPLVLGALLVQAAPAAPKPLVLTHANVIDVRSGRPLPDATLVLSGGKIERIARGPVPAPAGADVIDLQGRYVLPGLIDAHTHIADRAAARRALESGVTTVRSASTPFFEDVGLRELVRRGVLAGPEVLAAGLFVTPDLGESVLADPRLAELAGGVNTPDELRALVRINADHGVDVIKTRATERAGLPEQDPRKQVYTEAQLRVIVEAAAAKGLPVMCHAHGDEGARAAVRAGVRSIEHGTYLSDSTLALMKQRGTYFVPTYSTVVDLTEPGGDYDNPALRIRGQAMLPHIRQAVRRAHEMGVKIVTGGDTEYGPGSTVRIPMEVARFVELGMTPLEAIQSATTVAAELLGIERRTGSLQEGFEADLIVVGENPLADITALQDVQVVISNGRVALNRLPFGK
ncbi:MAG TPA: amidohydrolase family protein [Gemmatimonadales bacterium]|nr:amidohydrolase family protein [Gemmatimonadales bacterium]